MKLSYQPPLAWEAYSRFVAGRSAAAVECFTDGGYWRTVRLGETSGWICVRAVNGNTLQVRAAPTLASKKVELRRRLHQTFDLAANPAEIEKHLSADAALRPLIRRLPGLRVPGAFDGFELAVRAILGQRISVRVATILAGKVAAHFGEPVDTPLPELSRLFPIAERLADVRPERLRSIGLGGPPVAAIRAVARAVADGDLLLEPGPLAERAVEQLQELPGIGHWTAHYIGMRALRLPDAFPHSDLGLCKALGLTPAKVLARAEAWRPYRAYAALHLWNSLSPSA